MSALALDKIATCYNPALPPGSGRLIQVLRDNGPRAGRAGGRYVVTQVCDKIGELFTRRRTEEAALAAAAALGYTDVLMEDSR